MKAKILISHDPHFMEGEIGEVLPNDSIKYDYFIKLPGTLQLPTFLGCGNIERCFYFYKNEVEIIKDEED